MWLDKIFKRKGVVNMKKKVVIGVLLVVVIIAVLIIVIKFSPKKKREVTDIKTNANEIELDVNRKFYLYDKDPLETEGIEALKEVQVVIKGKGNCDDNKFEGEVNIEGFELGGNFQSYNITKDENGYGMTCMGVNLKNEEAVTGPLYNYWVTISEDLKSIHIWITEFGKNDSDDYHWVMNSGY